MSRSRRPSNAESGTSSRGPIPDSYPDDYRDRGRVQDRNFRGGNLFYRRDFAQSRERNRTLEDDRPTRSNSFGGNAELGHERPGLLSRQSMQDTRLVIKPSISPLSKENSGQSSPKVNSGSRPISPKGDPPRSGAATPVATTASSTLASKPLAIDEIREESGASSKTDLPDEIAIKDPRLRRINTKAKQNAEVVTSSPTIALPQPLTPAVNKPAPVGNQSKDTEAAFSESTSSSSNAPNFSPSIPDTPFTGSGGVMKLLSALSDPNKRNPTTEATDVTMTDVNQAPTIVASASQDPLTAVQAPQGTAASSNLMDSFVKFMTDFADEVSNTSVLKYKKDIAKQKSSRCKYNDRRNREHFKDYPVTIEQGAQARQLAEQELASIDQKLKDQLKAQNELARTMGGFFVSQIEQQKSAQEIHPEQASMLQKSLDKVAELSANVASTLAEVKQAKLNAAKSVKEAYELVERATSTCKEAQQAAQKTFMQVNDVSVRLNELSRNATTLHADVSEDHVQIVKVMSLVERLEDDMRSLRKRTADAEDDVKSLWDDKAQSTVLERMRKDIHGDLAQLKNTQAQFKNTQRDVVNQAKSLEANLDKCLQSYVSLAPKVESHSKKIEELDTSPKTPGANDRKRLYGIEMPKNDAPEDERSESLVPRLQSDIEELQRSESLVQRLQSDIEELQRSFQDLSQKFESSATQSELVAIRDSTASLQTEIKNLNVAEISKDLEAYRKDAEADHEDLRELTKEVDKLHEGQDQIRDTFTAHNESIVGRVDKTEKDIHNISEELKVTFDKAKEEAKSIARQIHGVSKRVEATMTAGAARPTPPSAPATPQMHQSVHVPGRGSSPVIDNGVLTVRLNEVARDLMHLRGYINSQFSTSPNLPAALNSLNQAILSLQSRYNNLTTEPVVRAMVQQMQLMYPYASTAQNDIRNVQATITELAKLPPQIGLLTTQVDLHKRNIAKLDQNVNDQEKERVSSDNKQERLVVLMKEERDNLRQHVREQHEKLKQHVEERYDQMGRGLAAVKEESVLGVAQVAAKVSHLEQVADAWTVAKRAERLSQLSDKEATPKAVTQLKVNGPPTSRLSPKHSRSSSQTWTSSSGESDREALLKKFDASARNRRVAAKSSVSDSDDSDAPLALSRTNSSKSINAASPSGHAPGTSGKRKRAQDTLTDYEEQQPLTELLSSPLKRKVHRRS
jgi:predicted  nucleic acid-binding Zn-ribbon protein